MTASVGLRYDVARYDYEDRLDVPATARFARPPDGVVDYERLSPKIGVTWQATKALNVFASYRSAFRVPSQSQVFRPGRAVDTLSLQPVRAANMEVGLRTQLSKALTVELSAYSLDKRDDILTFRNPVDGAAEAVNNGHTRHRGIEIQAAATPTDWLRVSAAYTYARHEYEGWVLDPAFGLDYSGLEIETAPREIGNLIVSYHPGFLRGAAAAAEWIRLGHYWMDPANTHEYEGHDLLNLRFSAPVSSHLDVWLAVRNVTDERWAESASFTLARGEEFAPGAPRSFTGGLKVWLGR